MERLYQRWSEAGRPSRQRLGLTVTGTGTHRFWLDVAGDIWWTDNER